MSDYRLLKAGAAALHEAANCFEAIFRARSANDKIIAKLVAYERLVADAMVARASEIGPPSTALVNWNKGQREAMKNYKPAKPKGNAA